MKVVDQVVERLRSYGADRYDGEGITQLEHALQCASLATRANASDDLRIAALLHDIGHLCIDLSGERMGDYGIATHEAIGADYLLDLGFSDQIAKYVANHVEAKRYLAATLPGYYRALSEASKSTLDFQGGPMSVEEARQFESDPDFTEMVALRKWDEAAKQRGWKGPDLESYRETLERHIARQKGDDNS